MAADFDYYKILGIERSATDEEIKSAYRRMAKKYHPDLYSTASEEEKKKAEEQFKKINHAYQVLSDPQKKAMYDKYGSEDGPTFQGGSAGGGFGGFGGGFGGFDDILSSIFSGFGGGNTRSNASAPRKGQDITQSVTLEFKDACFGCEQEIKINRAEGCPDCRGTGAKGGTAYKTCGRCAGRGIVRISQNTMFGSITQEVSCPDCRGKGKIITDTCRVCGGKGEIRKVRVVKKRIPAGINHGQIMTYRGEGECGKNGGPNGDLVIMVNVKNHPLFVRKNNFDLYFDVPISFVTAALGGEIWVPTLTEPVSFKIPECTQSGTMFKIKGKGVKMLNKDAYGDIYFTVVVQVPSRLSRDQKAQLEKFESTLSPSQDEKQRKFKEYTGK